jgi:hypothetical protein
VDVSDGTRTPDLLGHRQEDILAVNEALSQLSYSPTARVFESARYATHFIVSFLRFFAQSRR